MSSFEYKHKQDAGCKHCAEYANKNLRKMGYNIRGNAWELNNKNILFSGYNLNVKPKKYNTKDVEEYNLNAANNVFKNFDSSILDKNKKYAVNMFYKGSNYQKEAYDNDTDGLIGTHEGILVFNKNNNTWDVVHNIDGTVHVDDFYKLQQFPNKWGITAILEPKERKGIFKYLQSLFFEKGGKVYNPEKDKETIHVGDKKFIVTRAVTDEERLQGLKGIKELPIKEGMLFDFGKEVEVSMYMKDTLIPLDIIFFDSDLEVIAVHKGEPNSEKLITEDDVRFVLEVNINSGIEEGDELDFTPYIEVLDKDGEVQMKLEGGERIISRKQTKVLIKKAKYAEKVKEDEEKYKKACKSLGSYMFKILKKQDETPIDYIS